MGPQKKRQPLTVFAFGKYWAHPPKMRVAMSTFTPLETQKTLSQKGFCGAFSLKKRPPRPQAPPILN